jgi:RNA polymerase sigma-70 factor (ECF subfamily)
MLEPELALPAVADASRSSAAEAAADSHARLRAMFAAHFAFVWRVLRRLGVAADAVDDAAQQVFLVATRRIDCIEQGSERAYLVSTAMRIAAEARRARGSRGCREQATEDLDAEPGSVPNPEELTDRKRALELLDRVLDAMPFELRTVFVLFEVEGLSTHTMAPMLELPRGTVVSRLRRAREEFHAIAKRMRARSTFGRGTGGGGHG